MSGVEGGEFSMREKMEVPSGLINAIVAGYQIALNKTLGVGAAAMTQLLIKEVGDFLEELLEDIGFEVHEVKDLKDDIPKAFKMLGISDKVEVETPSNGAEKGDKYIVRIHDSIFKPVAVLLAKKGINYTLSPESFIAAAIIRKAIRKAKPDAQVRIKIHPQRSPEDPLTIEVTVR